MFDDLGGFVDLLRKGDPLVIHTNKKDDLTDELKIGAKALEHHVFFPTVASMPYAADGHGQTFIFGFRSRFDDDQFPYDRRELFKFKDGGQIYVDFKGEHLQSDRPLLFIQPGFTCTSHAFYVQNIVKQAYERGFDIIALNWRGLADCPLTTPRLYDAFSVGDLKEPLDYYYEKYCKKYNRKAMLIGCSFGAQLVANYLGLEGDNSFLTAAVCIQAPMRLVELHKAIYAGGSIYDKNFGILMKDLYRDNEPQLRDYFKKEHNMDLKKTLDDIPDSGCACNETLTCKMFGYTDEVDYYRKAQCCQRIPNIGIPTLFFNSLDDPLIMSVGIDFEGIRKNKNTLLATTKTGGHLGFQENITDGAQWFVGPALDFLNIFRYQ